LTKALLIDELLLAFLTTWNSVASLSDNEILAKFPATLVAPSYTSRPDLLSKYFDFVFGNKIASAFRIPQSFPQSMTTPSSEKLLSELTSLINLDSFDLKPSRSLTKKMLKNILDNLHPSPVPIQTEKVKTLEIPDLTKSLLQTWKNEMKSQEEVILTRQRNAQDTSNQIGAQKISETEIGTNAIPTLNTSTSVKETETMTDKDVPFETREELLNRIIQEETLNQKQTIAFRIIANSFFKLMDDQKHGINSPMDSISFSVAYRTCWYR